MAVPKYHEFNRLVLEVSAESKASLSRKEVFNLVVKRLTLTDSELQEKTSGGVPLVENRVSWAIGHLKGAGLLEYPVYAKSQITQLGRDFLRQNHGNITNSDLKHLKAANDDEIDTSEPIDGSSDDITPDEQMANSHKLHRAMLSDQIGEGLKILTPSGFEQLVVILLSRMGYGDGRVTGKSGDHGIDGILTQDPLGLEKVYVQAKRWDTTPVSEPEIHKFYGSLALAGSDKGVFITASTFSTPARSAAQGLQSSKAIRLIDGQELAQLMIDYGVGVVTEITYEVKKLDANYFTDV